MDISEVNAFLRNTLSTHSRALQLIQGQQTKMLELAAVMGASEHYRSAGYQIEFVNPSSGEFTVKTGTRGHPANYSKIQITRDDQTFEIHMNLTVRSAHDEGIYCVDVAVVPAGIVPHSSRGQNNKWLCLDNNFLVTFAEVKKLIIYPMLLAQFLGIVHEIKPHFIGSDVDVEFQNQQHFMPSLISLGTFSGNSLKIVEAYRTRNISVNIVHNYDIRLAKLRRQSTPGVSPFTNEIFDVSTEPAFEDG